MTIPPNVLEAVARAIEHEIFHKPLASAEQVAQAAIEAYVCAMQEQPPAPGE